MFILQSPLETVATLAGITTLDVDTNQANRHCIMLNSAKGKESYYFATPIYNAISRKLINRKFTLTNSCYRFVGSNCEVTATATQLKLVQNTKVFDINFNKKISWSLHDGTLVSDRLSVMPTYNGVLINGRLDQLTFEATMKLSYQNIRTSQNCVCFMESRFKPILVISALYAQKQNSGCQPIQIKYDEVSKTKGSIRFISENPLYNHGVFVINFYETKLIQDTPVSGSFPKENNAFGPIAFIGKSKFYGTQWLYSRLDINKMPELQGKYIREVKLYIPRFTSSSTALNMFGLSNRFCSFGSNWSNKVQKDEKQDCVSIRGNYVCVDLTKTYIDHGRLSESAGMVLAPSRTEELGYQAISTGDSYAMPPILCVKYANQ